MQIQNLSRQTTLATNAQRAHTYRDRFLGLMFREALPEGGGLLLEPEGSIHTFFMRFPIDVLYLDRDSRVLRAVQAMPPNRIGPVLTRGCHAILELPAGVILQSGTQAGDQLRIESETNDEQ
ncbi:MAG TPA: DUF192 domain-containing protein [Ardenticatenaceae bacterium]